MTESAPNETPGGIPDDVQLSALPWYARIRKRLSSRYIYAILDQGIFSFGNLVVYATFKRHSTLAEYGVFYLALRSLDILNQICSTFIWGPIIFNLPTIKEDNRYARYLGSNLVIQAICSAFAVGLLFALAGISRLFGGSTYDRLFLPLAIPSITIIFREFTRRIYFAQMRFREAMFTDAITVTLQMAGIFYLIHTHKINYENTLWALSLGCIAVIVYSLIRERKHFRFSFTDIRSDLKLNLKLGRWFAGTNLLFAASQQANSWILNGVLGPTAVGSYAICEQIINFPRVALVSMQNAIGPSMAHAVANGGKPALRKVVRRMDILLTIGSAWMAVATVVFGPTVSRIIFHTQADHAGIILAFLSLNLFAYASSLPKDYALAAIHKPDLNLYAAAFGLVAQLVLSFIIVHRYQATGVAFAVFVGNFIVWMFRIWYYVREMREA